MSRPIDGAMAPTHPLEKKVIVLSLGRNGTMSLARALQILGYRSYHMKDALRLGTFHLSCFRDGILANRFGEGEPFGKAEFEKWMGEYDAIVDFPSLFPEEMVAMYPDAKFILTTREPSSWVRSVRKTFLAMTSTIERFPLRNILQLTAFTRVFVDTMRTLKRGLFTGVDIQDDAALMSYYTLYNKRIKNLVPPERLLVVKLENGFGWEEICPFLEKEIPEVPYPRGNDPKEFHKLVNKSLLSAAASSFGRVLVVGIPVISFGIWYYLRQQS